MSLKDVKQKFSELRDNVISSSYSEQRETAKSMIDLLREYPTLCSDALDMIEEKSYLIDYDCEKDLLNSITEIKPELSINIIQRFDKFSIDYEYIISKIGDILQKQPDLAEQVIESVTNWEEDERNKALTTVLKNRPDLFSKIEDDAQNKSSLILEFIKSKNELSEKDINLILGEFSYKNFCKLYNQYKYINSYITSSQQAGLNFIEKVAKGNPNNKEILKKCLLMMYDFDADKTKKVTNEILALQPELKDFSDRLNILKLRIPDFPKLEKIKNTHKHPFVYTTGNSDLTQLQYRINVREDAQNTFVSPIKKINEQQESVFAEISKIEKALDENADLNEIIKRFNSLAEQNKGKNYIDDVNQKLKEQRAKIGLKIKQAHQYYGKQIQQILNSPEKINGLLKEIDFSDDTSTVLASTICTLAERTKNQDVLKLLSHKKEEAYGVWDYRDISELEDSLAQKNYIAETLNKKYPNLSLEEQLIQAAYDVVKSGDEQKKKEFNDLILAEGEPRLAELDAKVMDYLHKNCTQDNLDKVNALRSFYGLKVELATGKEVNADERTAVRKVFDRTWSSYERGKNTETGEPYYSEAELEQARKENPDKVESNPYYENSVSPAYRKYFEENDIYQIYHSNKSSNEKKYSAQNYFDQMIDKSSFKALRKHGLYNDMKIICDTLEALQIEPEIATQFNLKDLSDMVVNSHNTLEDRKVYNQETGDYMFTKSPHTDELNGSWRSPYYWYDDDNDDDDEYDDKRDSDEYSDDDSEDEKSSVKKEYDEEGFEIIPVTGYYSEYDEEPAARDTWWENLADHNPKAVKHISEAMKRHGREDDAISGFWKAASYGTPGVGSRRDWRLLSATLHHAEAIQYGGNDDKKNFVGTTRYYDYYGDTFAKDDLHIDYHKSFHRRDTPFDALYINPNAKSAGDKLATENKPDESAQKAFLITSFTDPHMHFYAGFRKKDQYTAPLYHMRNIEKEKQERVRKTEQQLTFLTNLANAVTSIAICTSEACRTEEKIKKSTQKIAKTINILSDSEKKSPSGKPPRFTKAKNKQYA